MSQLFPLFPPDVVTDGTGVSTTTGVSPGSGVGSGPGGVVRNQLTGAPYGPSVTVTAAWTGDGGVGDITCTTGVDGSCSLSLTGLDKGTKVSFVVTSVAGPGLVPPTSYPAEIKKIDQPKA